MALHSILCPIDFGPASLEALKLAVDEAVRRDAVLDLHHVWQPGIGYGDDGPPIPFSAECPREKIEADLESLETNLPADRVRRHVSMGSPASDIVDLAEELGSELVVMGTHARHGLNRYFIGSVCEAVLRDCPCPVLVCRAPKILRATSISGAK